MSAHQSDCHTLTAHTHAHARTHSLTGQEKLDNTVKWLELVARVAADWVTVEDVTEDSPPPNFYNSKLRKVVWISVRRASISFSLFDVCLVMRAC